MLLGIDYLNQGLYPLITGKPVFKAYRIRSVVMPLLIVQLLLLLMSFFLAFVKLYGYSDGNITIGNWPFYILLFLFCLLVLWRFYWQEIDLVDLKYNITLVAVDSAYALVAVRDTLANMAIRYEETPSGFAIPDKDIGVSVTAFNNKICFSVAKPLDKIFLNQFCRTYQTVYSREKYPIKRNNAMLSTAVGLTILLVFILILFMVKPFSAMGLALPRSFLNSH